MEADRNIILTCLNSPVVKIPDGLLLDAGTGVDVTACV